MLIRVPTTDPWAFVLHKWFASQRPDREPAKHRRDEAQAKIVATILHHELTNLPVTTAISRATLMLLNADPAPS